jgi:hypothetical protein
MLLGTYLLPLPLPSRYLQLAVGTAMATANTAPESPMVRGGQASKLCLCATAVGAGAALRGDQ